MTMFEKLCSERTIIDAWKHIKVKEKRRLGLLTIKDKIVQQAIRNLIEPKMERMFIGNSYGYRPNKGALKAIRRALQE